MKRTKRDIENEINDKIILQLQNGVAPWRKSWTAIDGGVALRENGVPYRGWNQFLLSLAGYGNPYWLTFNKAAELCGRGKYTTGKKKGKWLPFSESPFGVKADEDGTHVHFFKKLKIKDKVTGDDKMIPLIKFYCVFNADQCEGLPAKYLPAKVERTPLERDAVAEAYIANLGAKVKHGGAKAFYVPSKDYIQLPEVDTFDDYTAYVGTSVHEHAHWSGHESRLDRNLMTSTGSRDYAREELVAECSAALILGHLGLEVEPREDHAAYLGHWLELLKSDKTALRKAFGKAQKVVDFLDGLQPVEQEQAA